MPWNGSGSFSLNQNFPSDRDAGAPTWFINADKVQNETQNLADGLENCVTIDGQTTPSANLPMAGFKHTGVGLATSRTDYARASQLQDFSLNKVGTVAGTGDAITGVLTPAITAYAGGAFYTLIAPGANTIAAPTININGVGLRTIKKFGGALVAGDYATGDALILYDDGSFAELINPRYPIIANDVAGVFGFGASGVPTYIDAATAGFVLRDLGTGTAPAFGDPTDATSMALVSAKIARSSILNAQTGTSYAILTGDRGKRLTFSNAAAIAVSIAQAGASFPDGWFTDIENLGEGVVTVTPATSTVDGATTIFVPRGFSCRLASNGTNYFTRFSPIRRGRRGADIATATTLTLPTALMDYHQLTGVTTTTGLGAALGGTEIELVSTGIAQFTHNATSFILLGGANITTAAGDVWRFRNDSAVGVAGSNWRMVAGNRASGKPIIPTNIAAVQADQETATSNVVFTTPGVQQFHPSAAKWWVKWTKGGTTITASYNVTSITRNSAGKYTITFATAMSSSEFFVNVGYSTNGTGRDIMVSSNTPTTTTVDVMFSTSGAPNTGSDDASVVSYFAHGFGDF